MFVVAFLASAVEMVEAATIVLAVGVTRGTRPALAGFIAALLVLAIAIGVGGPLLSSIPLAPLRLVVGTLALLFGLDWLRKAILRAGGVKAMHDEAEIYVRETQATAGRISSMVAGIDRLGFIVSFKAVLLEGLEVVVIVITLGSAQRDMTMAVLGAAVAFVLVTAIAGALRKPLTKVPENAMKMIVGVMLVSFGTFWAAEGAGVRWPGDATSIVGLVVWFAAAALLASATLRRSRTAAI